MAALLLLVFLYHFAINSSVIQAANDHHQENVMNEWVNDS